MLGKDFLAPLLELFLCFPDRVFKVVELPLAQPAACLYVAGIFWCIIFDIIYAHQDYLDDLKAGVKGLAARLGKKGTKPALYAATILQVYCLVLASRLGGFGRSYYAISCEGDALFLTWMI